MFSLYTIEKNLCKEGLLGKLFIQVPGCEVEIDCSQIQGCNLLCCIKPEDNDSTYSIIKEHEKETQQQIRQHRRRKNKDHVCVAQF